MSIKRWKKKPLSVQPLKCDPQTLDVMTLFHLSHYIQLTWDLETERSDTLLVPTDTDNFSKPIRLQTLFKCSENAGETYMNMTFPFLTPVCWVLVLLHMLEWFLILTTQGRGLDNWIKNKYQIRGSSLFRLCDATYLHTLNDKLPFNQAHIYSSAYMFLSAFICHRLHLVWGYI